jgi:hypothetical protein
VTAARGALAATAVSLSLLFAACGGEEPAGSDPVGMNLEDARELLKKEGIEVTIGDTDTLMGVIIESNFVVCKVHAVNDKIVRVDVAKRGC